MSKPTKKRIKYNEDVLIALHLKHGYSIDYIRKSLRGDRVGFMPDKFIKEYGKLCKEDEEKKESHPTGGGKWTDKVFKENTTPCGWRFFLKPVGLDLFRPIVTAYTCCLFYSFGIIFFTYSLICKMLVVLFNSFGEI